MSAGCVTNTDNHLTVGTGFATGTWSQTGADVQNQKNFIVGAAHGAGTFDLAGGTVTSGATLSFKLGADGVTPIRCYGNVTIGAGTKLKVDFTDYAGTERRIPLVVIDDGTKWSFSGSVASSDIEVTGVPEGRAFVLDQKGAQLIARLRGTGGMAVLLK